MAFSEEACAIIAANLTAAHMVAYVRNRTGILSHEKSRQLTKELFTSYYEEAVEQTLMHDPPPAS